MASGRVERAQELVELWNSGNFEKWLDEVGSEFEFTPDPSFPDADTYRGDEFRRWMRDWVATWRERSCSSSMKATSALVGWRPFSIPSRLEMRPGGLADSPVNGCMLRSTRLGCLKKPTEEARGG